MPRTVSDKALLERFDAWRLAGRPLALATVVATLGSTYTKPGQRMLITESGDFQGMVSGGCLEGDLAVHAQQVLASGTARLLTYDLGNPDEGLFGLDLGCDGLLRVLVQCLAPADDFEPMTTLAALLRGDTPTLCTVLLSPRGALPMGTTLLGNRVIGTPLGGPGSPGHNSGEGAAEEVSLTGGDPLSLWLNPLPRLLVLGAGLDAVPVVTLAETLGWRVTLVDHRPSFLARPAFRVAEACLLMPAAELASRMPLATFTAALVMTHHLATDRCHLNSLAGSPVPYIGLLGPSGRRDRLVRDLGPAGLALAGRLHGPAGLDIGANSPASIALSILSQIHGLTRVLP